MAEGWGRMVVFTLTLGVKRGIIAMCRLAESLILIFHRTIENRRSEYRRSAYLPSWAAAYADQVFSGGIDSRRVLKGFDWKAV